MDLIGLAFTVHSGVNCLILMETGLLGPGLFANGESRGHVASALVTDDRGKFSRRRLLSFYVSCFTIFVQS